MPNNPYRANWTGEGPLRKFIVPHRKVDGDNREITFTISTSGVDRDGDIIDQSGWELGNYIKNPVVLWAHDGGKPPIARAKSIRLSAGALVSTAVFATKDEFEFADTVFKLYKGGFLNAVSVGFQPKELELIEGEEPGMIGFRFLKQELMEFSAVPVPSNPEALIVARGQGIDIDPMKSWIEKLLDGREAGALTNLLDRTYIALNGKLHPVMRDALAEKNLRRPTKDDSLDSTDPEIDPEGEEEVVEPVVVQSGPTNNPDASEPHTHEIEVGSAQTAPYGDDGHIHAITYDAEGVATIEEAEGHGHDAPTSANIKVEEVEGDGTEDEAEDEDKTVLEVEIPNPADTVELTDWPAAGMNLKVCVLTSEYRAFPVAEAQALQEDFPAIWDMGEGDLFEQLVVGDKNAVRAREKWAARNVDGYDLPAVVSQIRHLVRSSRGIEYVRLLLSHTKEQLTKIPDPVVEPAAPAPAPVVEVDPADVIGQVMERGVIPAIEAAIRAQTGRVS